MHARTKDQPPILGIIDIGAPSRPATGITSARPDQCQALVAALALGIDGINMGTRFIATKEAPAYDNVKRVLVAANQLPTRPLALLDIRVTTPI